MIEENARASHGKIKYVALCTLQAPLSMLPHKKKKEKRNNKKKRRQEGRKRRQEGRNRRGARWEGPYRCF
jgi:hypothetical protein